MVENCRGCRTKCANQGFWWHFPVESLWFRVLKMSLDIWVFESPWSNDPAGRKQMSLSKLKSHSYQGMPLCIDEQQLCQSSVSTWLVVLTRPQKTLKNLRFLSHFSNHFLSNFLLFHLSLSLSQRISTFMYQLILAKVHWKVNETMNPFCSKMSPISSINEAEELKIEGTLPHSLSAKDVSYTSSFPI